MMLATHKRGAANGELPWVRHPGVRLTNGEVYTLAPTLAKCRSASFAQDVLQQALPNTFVNITSLNKKYDAEQKYMNGAGTGGTTPLNVVCIKWGAKYPPYYVNRLFRGVARHLARDHRFVCFTDDPDGIEAGVEVQPLPVEPFEADIVAAMQRRGRKGAWRKISLFRPGLAGMSGRMLGFDLDVAITGRLDDLVDYAPDKVCMRREWRYEWQGREGGHGSVFCFDPALHPYLYEDFARDPAGSVERHRGSEQYYTSMTALGRGNLAYWPGDLIASFKRNSMRVPPFNFIVPPALPENCRVMCFHGKPKMDEVLAGYRGNVVSHTMPAPWLREHWLGE